MIGQLNKASQEELASDEIDDLNGFLDRAIDAMTQYLSIPDSNVVIAARRDAANGLVIGKTKF